MAVYYQPSRKSSTLNHASGLLQLTTKQQQLNLKNIEIPATMPPKSSKASKAAFGLTGGEYKLLCGVIVNGEAIQYDLPSVTKYMGSIREESTKIRVTALWRKIRRDAYDIAGEMGAKAKEAIRNAAAAPAPRKRARKDSEYGNDNRNVNSRHHPGFSSSSLSARIPGPPLAQQQLQTQQQSQQQHQKLHQIPVTSRTPSAIDTRGLREFSVPAQNQNYETPPPAYTRFATAGTGVINPAPVINSNNTVNQGVGVDMGMDYFSVAQMFGAEGPGSGFGYGLDGDGFPLGINQVGNGSTFGVPAGPAPLAYPGDARNGFGLPNNNSVSSISISNHPNYGYMGNKKGVNGDAMGFAVPNGLDYNLSVDSAVFFDQNLRLGDALLGTMDNDLYGMQNNFFNPPADHSTGSNSNGIPQNGPIATVNAPAQPVFQPVFQPAQNVQALNNQNVNLDLDFLGENGNGNGNTAAPAKPDGVQPEVALPILEKLPVSVPAAEPTPAPTPATAEDRYTVMLQQQQQQQQLPPQELQQKQELQQEQKQQPLQGQIDSWDVPFLQEQEQLPQEGFDSVEEQLLSMMTAEGYGLGLPDL